MTSSLTTCITLLLFLPAASWGQQAAEGGSLKEVQVINTSPLPGIGIEKNKLPYDAQSVNSQTLKNSNTLNITEFMNENLNGVNLNDIQGSPYQADVTYRGSRASATLGAAQGLSVYMDGVRVNEPFGDVVNWDMLPEAAFENVTLVPGSNPIYGLNTLGGALAFTTKSGLTTQGNELGLSLGSFGRLKLDVTHGGKSNDGWHRFVAASAFAEDGWRDYSKGNLQNLFVKLGRTKEDTNWDISFLSGNSKLRGNGLLPSTNYGVAGADANSPGAGIYETDRNAIYSHVDITENTTNLLTFNVQHMLDADSELASTVYVRSGKQNRLSGEVVWCAQSSEEDDCVQKYGGSAGNLNSEGILGLFNGSKTSQTSGGASLNLTKVMSAHQLTLGAALDGNISEYSATQATDCVVDDTRGVSSPCTNDTHETAGVKGRSWFLGVYAADTYKLNEATHLSLAARFNHAHVQNTITGQNEENISFDSLNPSIGLTHQLNNRLSLYGNWAQSNRVPTVIELGCADPDKPCQLPTGLQADPPLKQVVSQTIEGGMRWQDAHLTFSISAYQTVNKDDILFLASPTTTGAGYFNNFDKTQYQGLDLQASQQWGAWRLSTTYSYLKATYEDSATLPAGDREMTITPGMRLPGIPEHHLKVHLNWQANDKLSVGASTVYASSTVSQANEDGFIANGVAGHAHVKGYNLLHLRANYQVQKGLEVFGKINNLLDTRYETYGLLHQNNFNPDGSLLSGAQEPTLAKFIAPGAPRTYMVGLRYQF